MKLEPLKQFKCDTCGQVIERSSDGWLEWLKKEDMKLCGFRIVHHASASPRQEHDEKCEYARNQSVSGMHLEDFMGSDGLAHLLTMFDRRLKDQNELLEIIRRLHIPHYEEARLHCSTAKEKGFFDGANEVWPYLQDTLKDLIQRYGGEQP